VRTIPCKTILTFWLLPADAARAHFRTAIRDLARRFDAPIFEPHLTLYTTDSEREDARGLLEQCLADQGPLRLRISGIGHSQQFTKTLFVQFEPDQRVTALNAKFQAASLTHRRNEINPHLSLLYKKMASSTQAEVAASLRIPFSEVEFDAVKAIISPAPIKSRREIEAWRVVAEKELR